MALPFEIELDVNSVVGLLNSNDDSLANFAPMVDHGRGHVEGFWEGGGGHIYIIILMFSKFSLQK